MFAQVHQDANEGEVDIGSLPERGDYSTFGHGMNYYSILKHRVDDDSAVPERLVHSLTSNCINRLIYVYI